ncbi:MAG: B12-binding domain-containing radical SAM protein [Candidatus Nealsonbacteria bacterium]|nr:B12-binding domain-containing radical SAM protein [Candidatus Nealsonbacteria bacterium]
MKVLFIYPNTMASTLVPINLSQLSACLKEKGFEVDLFDTTFYKTEEVSSEQKRVELLQIKPFNLIDKGLELKKNNIYDDLRKKISKFQPDLIGFTLVEDTWELAKSLLSVAKDFDIPVIAGGVLVTAAPEEIISHPDIDMVCLGEGEETLIELCQKIERGEDYSNIKNIWIKKDLPAGRQGGKIVKNPLRGLQNIDALPYIDYEIWGRERLGRPMFGKIYTMIHVEIDRGCPNQCAYCAAPVLSNFFIKEGCGSYYRRKKIPRVMAELEYLAKKYRPDYINFNSETFLAKPIEELKEFAGEYKKRIHLPFWAQTRPETITEQKLEILKEMGVDSMNFGIEHGNEEFRGRVLHRYGSNEQIVRGIRLVEKYQIPYTANNIIGFPEETRDLIFDTIELNRQLNPRTINCSMFVPYRGTPLREYCLEKGYLDENAKVHNVTDGVRLKMASISYEELKGLQRTFSLYIRFPKSEWPRIKIAEKFDEEGNGIFEEYKKIYREKYF